MIKSALSMHALRGDPVYNRHNNITGNPTKKGNPPCRVFMVITIDVKGICRSLEIKLIVKINYDNIYLVTFPVPLTSIFLKRAVEKNDGSLHISLVISLNSDIQYVEE